MTPRQQAGAQIEAEGRRRDSTTPAAAPGAIRQSGRGLEAEDIRRLVIFSLTLMVVVPMSAWLLGGFRNWTDANWRLGLDGAAFLAAPLSTRVHALFVLTLTASGWGIIALPKGDRRHKTLALRLTVPHGPNWIAAYVGGASAYPLLAHGGYAVKRRDRRRHGRTW
jgi:hypothetical protein